MIRVMIVDDEYIMRQGLKYMIDWGKEGFEIVGEATNGKEALQLMESLEPHIVITDIVMPQLDGVDFSEALHNLYPQVQIIILSGYDKFEYVKQTLLNGAVDYVLKPTLTPEELLAVLEKATGRIPSYKRSATAGTDSLPYMVERALLGADKGPSEALLSDFFGTNYYCLFGFKLKQKNAEGLDLSQVLYQKVLRQLAANTSIKAITSVLREEVLCLLIGIKPTPQAEKELNSFLEELTDQLRLLYAPIFTIRTKGFKGSQNLKEICEQSLISNLSKAFYHEGLYFAQEEELTCIQADAQIKFDFFRYNQLLVGKQYAAAIEEFSSHISSALATQMDSFSLKNQVKNLLYLFLDYIKLEPAKKESLRHEFFVAVDEAAYERTFRIAMVGIVKELSELANEADTVGDERMAQILEYIGLNYSQDLKLETLAEEFNFNYSYLSAYFNQQMQEGFSDYLNRLRVERACQLLTEGELPISQVSLLVGYSDHSYFCRVFKKLTGQTPSSWRRSRYGTK